MHVVCPCCTTGAPGHREYGGVCIMCFTAHGCARCQACGRRWHHPETGDIVLGPGFFPYCADGCSPGDG